MRKASLLVLFLTVFIDLIGFGMVIPFLSYYARVYGASGVTVGAIVGVYSIMQFFFAPVWGRLSDRIASRTRRKSAARPLRRIAVVDRADDRALRPRRIENARHDGAQRNPAAVRSARVARDVASSAAVRGDRRALPDAALRFGNGDERDAARDRALSFPADRSRIFFSVHGRDRGDDSGRLDRQA